MLWFHSNALNCIWTTLYRKDIHYFFQSAYFYNSQEFTMTICRCTQSLKFIVVFMFWSGIHVKYFWRRMLYNKNRIATINVACLSILAFFFFVYALLVLLTFIVDIMSILIHLICIHETIINSICFHSLRLRYVFVFVCLKFLSLLSSYVYSIQMKKLFVWRMICQEYYESFVYSYSICV